MTIGNKRVYAVHMPQYPPPPPPPAAADDGSDSCWQEQSVHDTWCAWWTKSTPHERRQHLQAPMEGWRKWWESLSPKEKAERMASLGRARDSYFAVLSNDARREHVTACR